MPKSDRADRLELLEEARPIMRTGIALLDFLRQGTYITNSRKGELFEHYRIADLFIEQLKKDLEG